jgi:molybdate transport system regulatory protein
MKKQSWTCGKRLWIERGGQVVLGKGRVALLEAIEKQHSIRKAAASVGMSYRRAWLLVQSMNDAASQPLVEAAKGGANGGGATLTDYGKSAIVTYHGLEAAVHKAAERFLQGREI